MTMPLPDPNPSSPMHAIHGLLAAVEPGVLAIIVGVEGPSYRPLGAMMAVLSDKSRLGSLSSGCIEADIALHAMSALESDTPTTVNYGRHSPYKDIQLPCGGALEILLVPRPDREVLEELRARHDRREPCTLRIDIGTGDLSIAKEGKTGFHGSVFDLRIEPELSFFVFGKGPEAQAFAGLAQTLGYPHLLLSPDDETLDFGAEHGCQTRHLTGANFPTDLNVDSRSAVVLFFHDHDWEPPILAQALRTPAFYVGAQGSQRARDTRLRALRELHVPEEALARLKGPIGLVPSVRDARTLAVSVLAEILAAAREAEL